MSINHANLWELPAHELATLVSGKKISPVDIVSECLARIRARDHEVGAFADLFAEDAMAAAIQAEKDIASSGVRSALHGIPITLKDLIDVEGRATSAGSAAHTPLPAAISATVVTKLRNAGAIILGKTNTAEYALGPWGINHTTGTPKNPRNLKDHYAPGGSSSGSGASVAAGFAPISLGTDTGGSIRLPSSFCGLTGLKPSAGRISYAGIVPLSTTLDSLGPLTRSVEDAAIVLDLLSGPDPLDQRTYYPTLPSACSKLKAGLKGVRLARLAGDALEGVADDVLTAYEQSVATFKELGAEIVVVELPHKLADLVVANFRIVAAEGYAGLKAIVDDPSSRLSEHSRQRLAAGRAISAADYINELDGRRKYLAALLANLGDCLALLTPTTKITARTVQETEGLESPAYFTPFVNLMNLCALALPNGMRRNGFPTSLQIVGRPFAEEEILRIGWAFESVTNWRMPIS